MPFGILPARDFDKTRGTVCDVKFIAERFGDDTENTFLFLGIYHGEYFAYLEALFENKGRKRLIRNDVTFDLTHVFIHFKRFVLPIDEKFVQSIYMRMEIQPLKNAADFGGVLGGNITVHEQFPALDVRDD